MLVARGVHQLVQVVLIVVAVVVVRGKVVLVQVTDTHIGEGCNGDLSYDNCKPTRALTDAVRKINMLDPRPTAVLLTGDITSSALMPEFAMANSIMSELRMPWLPIIGNHDSWPYERHADGSFSQTDTPTGDEFFAAVFGERLKEGPKGDGGVWVSGWPTSSCVNGDFGFNSWHHNFVLTFPALENFKVIGLDWTARGNALPEPGVGPEAELHDYPGGTLPWLDTQLRTFASEPSANTTRFFLAQHHPFHNREAFSPFGRNEVKNFTFDNVQSAAVQDVFSASKFGAESLLGVIAGHMHRWFYGDAWTRFTALDNKWMKVREWETSACKGWDIDENFISAFTTYVFDLDASGAPALVNVDYLWKTPTGLWMGKPTRSDD